MIASLYPMTDAATVRMIDDAHRRILAADWGARPRPVAVGARWGASSRPEGAARGRWGRRRAPDVAAPAC
jgi:hypothetical protein